MSDENVFDQAVDAANIFEDRLDTTGLSWRLMNIDDEVDEEGRMCGTDSENGRKGKIGPLMVIQIGLAIYYAVSYVLLLEECNNYYIWPPPPDDSLVVDPLAIRSDEKVFQCEGTTYYLACEGPKYENATDSGCSSGSGAGETWMISLAFWVIFIGLIIFFCFQRLYHGLYNTVLGLVQFQVKKDLLNQDYAHPVKFAVAFTLFCNFAKGAPSSMKSEACGRLVFFGGDLNTVFEALLALIYLVSFVIIFFLVLGYGINLYCSCCPESPVVLCLMVTFCRFILLVAVVSQFILRIVRFNWQLDFDWNYPAWAALSVVSWVDLLVSLLADAYFSWAPWIHKALRRRHQVREQRRTLRRRRQVHEQGDSSMRSPGAEEGV